MRMDKLTSKFQLALADAQSLAVGLDHQLIEPDHVMVALLDQEGGSIRPWTSWPRPVSTRSMAHGH